MKFYSSYLQSIYSDPADYKKLISRVATRLRNLRKRTPFDAIAFRGTSGAAIAYPVSARLGVPLICVRKKGDDGHHSGVVEGSNYIDVKRYIIIDDFIASGNTMDEILSAVNREAGFTSGVSVKDQINGPNMHPNVIQCVAIVLYTASPARNKANRFYRDIPLVCIQKR